MGDIFFLTAQAVPVEQKFFRGEYLFGTVFFQVFFQMFVVFNDRHCPCRPPQILHCMCVQAVFLMEQPDFFKQFGRCVSLIPAESMPDIVHFAVIVRVLPHIYAKFTKDSDYGIVFPRTCADGIPQLPDALFKLFTFFLLIHTEQMIYGYAEDAREDGEQFHIRVCPAVFPAADGLEGHAELVGEFVLCHVPRTAEGSDVIADVQFHDNSLSV